jgi:hypothetical protein
MDVRRGKIDVLLLVTYSVLTATAPTVLSEPFWVYYTTSPTQSCSLSNSSDCICLSGYIPTPNQTACRLAMTFTMDATIEIIYAIGLTFMIWSFLSLKNHIGNYGEKMSERNNMISQIKVKNDALKDELDKELSRTNKAAHQEGSSFLSPISKVIRIIRDIQVNEELDDETVDALDYVVHLLLSNHLFKPQLMNSNMESEVSQWLKQITANEQEGETAFAAVKVSGRKVTNSSEHHAEFQKKLIILEIIEIDCF